MLLYDIFYYGGQMDSAVPLPKSDFHLIRYVRCVNGPLETLYPNGQGGWTKEPPIRNYAVYFWGCANKWVSWGRFGLLGATDKAGKAGIVIDLVTKRMIWSKGKHCDRAKPIGIRSLPAVETYQNSTNETRQVTH